MLIKKECEDDEGWKISVPRRLNKVRLWLCNVLLRRLIESVLNRRMKSRKYRFAARMHSEIQANVSSEVRISLNGFVELLQAHLHVAV